MSDFSPPMPISKISVKYLSLNLRDYKPNDNWFDANVFVGTAVDFVLIFHELCD